MGWLTARRHHERLPPGLVRQHPADARAAALEREQARIVARLDRLQIYVDLPTRSAGAGARQEGKDGAVPR